MKLPTIISSVTYKDIIQKCYKRRLIVFMTLCFLLIERYSNYIWEIWDSLEGVWLFINGFLSWQSILSVLGEALWYVFVLLMSIPLGFAIRTVLESKIQNSAKPNICFAAFLGCVALLPFVIDRFLSCVFSIYLTVWLFLITYALLIFLIRATALRHKWLWILNSYIVTAFFWWPMPPMIFSSILSRLIRTFIIPAIIALPFLIVIDYVILGIFLLSFLSKLIRCESSCRMKKRNKILLSITLIFFLFSHSFLAYFFMKQHIVSREIDSMRAYKVNNELFIEGGWDAFIFSQRLTSSAYRIKDGKLIVKLYARTTLSTPPYFLVYIPVPKIPNIVYFDDETGELHELHTTPKDSIKNTLASQIGSHVTAEKIE